MEKEKFEIQFIDPKNIIKKTFHSTHPEAFVQKMNDAGYLVIECQKSKKEDENDNALLRAM